MYRLKVTSTEKQFHQVMVKHSGNLRNERPALYLRLQNAQPKFANIRLKSTEFGRTQRCLMLKSCSFTGIAIFVLATHSQHPFQW